MDINLKSSVGRRFSATFDPVTVASLLSLATIRGGQAVYQGVELALDNWIASELWEKDNQAVMASLEGLRGGLINVANLDISPRDVLDAFDVFLAEYKLLQTGSGSERACMETFMSLCELLQGG